MKLIGFMFISSQAEFEKWQRNNPRYSVHTVIPHMQKMNMQQDGKEEGVDLNAIPQWGVFVTYIYEGENGNV